MPFGAAASYPGGNMIQSRVPSLQEFIGLGALLGIQNGGVDLRLEPLLLDQQLCNRLALAGRNCLNLALIKTSLRRH